MLAAFTVTTPVTREIQQASVTDSKRTANLGTGCRVCHSGAQGAVLFPVESLGGSAFVCMSFTDSNSMARLTPNICVVGAVDFR